VNLWHTAAIFTAGVAAGGINAVVGSGSLITFPTLVALGYPPVVANVSNNVGLVPGSAAGTLGYRRELTGQHDRLLRLGSASLLGSLLGGALLISLPAEAFDVIVPALIIVALVLVLVQPRLNAWVMARRETPHPHGGPWLWLSVFLAGVYGGYFGAAQGIILMGLLGTFLDDGLHRLNGAKNALSGIVNTTAAVLFVFIAPVNWRVVLLIALGSALGGFLGASVGRRLPPLALRGVIVLVGVIAIVKLLSG
jgi:uncharacterized protein